MNPWIETIGVIGLAAGAAVAAHRLAQLPRRYSITAYAFSGLVLLMLWLGRTHSDLAFIPPVAWVNVGRTKFALVAVVPILLLLPLFRRLPHRRVRFFGGMFLVLVVSLYAVWPFAASALNRKELLAMPTRLDEDGVCMQSTDYTCGPAAAVTALRQFGLYGQEGRIAVASFSSSAIGTPPDLLCEGLQKLYSRQGLKSELRYFRSLAELPAGQPVLAVIKYKLTEDHYVVILEVTPDYVVVADSNLGKVAYHHEYFMERWRKLGIVMSRAPLAKPTLQTALWRRKRERAESGVIVHKQGTSCAFRAGF